MTERDYVALAADYQVDVLAHLISDDLRKALIESDRVIAEHQRRQMAIIAEQIDAEMAKP